MLKRFIATALTALMIGTVLFPSMARADEGQPIEPSAVEVSAEALDKAGKMIDYIMRYGENQEGSYWITFYCGAYSYRFGHFPGNGETGFYFDSYAADSSGRTICLCWVDGKPKDAIYANDYNDQSNSYGTDYGLTYDNSDHKWEKYVNVDENSPREADAELSAKLNNDTRMAMACWDVVVRSMMGFGLKELGYENYTVPDQYASEYLVNVIEPIKSYLEKNGNDMVSQEGLKYRSYEETDENGSTLRAGYFRVNEGIRLWYIDGRPDSLGIIITFNLDPYGGIDPMVYAFTDNVDKNYVAFFDPAGYKYGDTLEWWILEGENDPALAPADMTAQLNSLSSEAVHGWVTRLVKYGTSIKEVGFSSYRDPSMPDTGTTFEVNGILYEITKDDKAAVKKLPNRKKVVIPDVVIFESFQYEVTEISAKAAKGNTKIKTVQTGNNVRTIGASAFAGCSSLKKIELNSSVITKIGKKAFRNIGKKATFCLYGGDTEKAAGMIKKATNVEISITSDCR